MCSDLLSSVVLCLELMLGRFVSRWMLKSSPLFIGLPVEAMLFSLMKRQATLLFWRRPWRTACGEPVSCKILCRL